MKILLTGGQGYIGRHISHYLLSCEDVEVVAIVDNLQTGDIIQTPEWNFFKGNYGDEKFMEPIFRDYEFDAIIHVGGNCDIDKGQNDPAVMYQNNVSQMISLLKLAVTYDVKYVVFSSSSTIYGSNNIMPVKEDYSLNPETTYAATKYMGELILRDFEKSYGIKSCILRYFNVAGAAMDGSNGEDGIHYRRLIPRINSSTDPKFPMTVYGNDYPTRDGTCVRDYIHVDDIARANYLGLKYIMEHNESITVNLGTDKGTTVLEAIHAYEECTGQKVYYEIGNRRPYPEPAELYSDYSKAKELLGFEPKYNIKDIVKSEYEWSKKLEAIKDAGPLS